MPRTPDPLSARTRTLYPVPLVRSVPRLESARVMGMPEPEPCSQFGRAGWTFLGKSFVVCS
jgi:hypothetical protein